MGAHGLSLYWCECLGSFTCESLHLCTVCVWHCENARLCVEGFYAPYINFHSFIQLGRGSADRQTDTETYRYAQTERERTLSYTRIKI